MTKRFLTFLLLGCLMMNMVPVAFAAETSENPYAGKVISIMGDSISTFTGQPHSVRSRYPDRAKGSGVDTVEDTWWMQLINDLDATLGISEAHGGSTVTNVFDVGEVPSSYADRKGPAYAMASWDRINDLDENGTPDVILFYGGTNDINAIYSYKHYTMGEFDPDTAPSLEDYDPAKDTAIKWDNVVDGYVAAILRMKATYPDAELIALLPINDKKNFNADIQEIFDHYGVPTVSLKHVSPSGLWDDLHPNAYGMDLITETVKAQMLGEDLKYPIHPDAPIRETPAKTYNDTNLWADPDNGYYSSRIWSSDYQSVTLSVKENDKIYASSFQKKGDNGSSNYNGIVVAFIKDGIVTHSLSGDEVYSAYQTNGYLLIPAGVDAVSIPMWVDDPNPTIKMLSLPERTLLKGDVSGDGKVGIVDYTILVRCLAGWEGYAEKIVSMEAADVNADGIVGIADATIFARYLAGWNGYDQYFE